MESELAELITIAGTTARPVDTGRANAPLWREVEWRLGLELPRDYKELIAVFGSATFAGFLCVLNPFSSNEHRHLERAAHRRLGAAHEVRRGYPDDVPYALFPESGGLLPWGFTTNGDSLFWLTEGPAAWWPTVILEGRGPAHERHALATTGVVVRFLRGTIASPLLLEPFAGRAPGSTPE